MARKITGSEKIHQLDKFDLIHRKEAMSYLRRIDAKPRGMRHAFVEEKHGTYWTDKAYIRFDKKGKVSAPSGYEPTEEEQQRITVEFSNVDWPEMSPTKTVLNPHVNFLKTPDKNIFDFYDKDGYIKMRQLRFERPAEEGGKIYVTYTYWSDGIWRTLEPEGLLPLWGIDRYVDQPVVFIHEGAKSARAIADAVSDGSIGSHPWGEELSIGLHVGWVGGAQNPTRTDWSFLREKNFRRAVIVLDRDRAGESALIGISKSIKMPATYIKFPETFPDKFDLADPFPDNLFSVIDGVRIYIGPHMDAFSGPATWMTNVEEYQVKSKKGKGNKVLDKTKVTLIEHARESVVYLKGIDRFAFVDDPHIQMNHAHFNRAVRHLSDVKDTAELIDKEPKFAASLTYDPSTVRKIISTGDDEIKLNLYRPSLIRGIEGDYGPYIEFMEKLIPEEPDRSYVLRWVATLIARPEIRMRYSLLMVSEQTGVGKTTLAEKILVPLVGRRNCSFPREGTLDGEFNDWVGGKRLAYVAEIYQGHNFKVTNALKSAISDGRIRVNAKYDKEYEVDNWCHLCASSNSLKALYIDDDDRRWLIPAITELRWGEEKFIKFYSWLGAGGLRLIRGWADGFGDYVRTGEHAPMTNRKFEVINEGKSQAIVIAEGIGRAMKEFGKPAVISDVDLHKFVLGAIRKSSGSRVYDSKLDLRKACIVGGAKLYRHPGGEGRIQFGRGLAAYALVNEEALALIKGEGEGNATMVRKIWLDTGGVGIFIDEEM